jgi:hypothetical protein
MSISALSNIEIASFLRWYVVVELHDHANARRYYNTYDMLEDEMMKVRSLLGYMLLVLSFPICNLSFNYHCFC